MKLIIAGGRLYQFNTEDHAFLGTLEGISVVVSGGAPGADLEGELWAEAEGIPVKKFPADWPRHGRAAGPIRNRQMAEFADAVVLFPGGRGTASMFKEASKANLEIFDRR